MKVSVKREWKAGAYRVFEYVARTIAAESAAQGVIAGLGWRGYEAAIRALVAMARESAE